MADSGDREKAEKPREAYEEWFGRVANGSASLGALLRSPEREQRERGYYHTIREICQQPLSWEETRASIAARLGELAATVFGSADPERARNVVLTGSGSSWYVADCLNLALQAALGLPVQSISSGDLLAQGGRAFPPGDPSLLVSFARSGNSPESRGVVDQLIEERPECRHLAITCNCEGKLATAYRDESRMTSLVLADRTCDRSLVMTSSFTNMTLAGGALGYLSAPDAYQTAAQALAGSGRRILTELADQVAECAAADFRAVIYLGDGGQYGAARESALKMMEMTDGRILTFAETHLGLRHGPMSAVRNGTMLVSFLAADPVVRAYQYDLLDEINRKELGARKLIVGENVDAGLARAGDLVLECPGLNQAGEAGLAIANVMVGQILGLFRCLKEGLQPDAPSDSGAISRVVQTFRIHRRG